MSDRVLVTGLSGFIASHVAEHLLRTGYAVRGTVRNNTKGEKIVRGRQRLPLHSTYRFAFSNRSPN